ncbi:MAG: hypothetical protein QT01_C0005G0003 [archaeon GW2011_AR6]|nr:MAG: hypothetical protein QT01_C0005G0003 [archaeon GW2011_AR6]
MFTYTLKNSARKMEKTTVILRGDVKEALEREFGKRKMSEAINEILFEKLIATKKKKGMFGADKWLRKVSMKDLRDERDRF